MKNQSQKLPWNNEQEFYELHAEELFSNFPFYHSAMMGETKEEFVKYIVKQARIKPGSKVIDLGCGSGYLVGAIRNFCESRGISTSKACIQQARKNYPEAQFEIGNMESYSLSGSTHFLALESMGYSDYKKNMPQCLSESS